MIQADSMVQQGLPTSSLWTEIYVKYGDTLYNKYRIIYLAVVEEHNEVHHHRSPC